MNIVSQLQELDNLIIELTVPPVRTKLRYQLAFATEQAEAHVDAVEKQSQTLARQIESYQRLEQAKADGETAALQKMAYLERENLALKAELARRDSEDATGFS